ncbi:DDE-type integrase/transposase/recombinase [Halobellus rufus]|uniref:DDE-type integrase/transposase/recombinase n=1 Tax=Halobellus rufus TaxID=1448860 RepID=UPI000678AD70|nr:DDE-type integrase/transposase/recombinase [Halobellus rufus]
MQEPNRLIECSDFPELEFVEREATPEPAMKLGIQLHLSGLSLSDTDSVLESVGAERGRTAVHNWVQKAGLQPTDGQNPDYVAVDETVIRVNNQRYWLFAAVDPDTDRLLHVRLFPTRTTALTEMFLVDGAPWLQAACHRHSLRFQHVTHGNRNAVEPSFKELKRRTEAFAIHFRHAEPNTAETWIQAFVVCFNQPI